jgi:hypothetical protein
VIGSPIYTFVRFSTYMKMLRIVLPERNMYLVYLMASSIFYAISWSALLISGCTLTLACDPLTNV